jgi:hypothetical protein
VSIYRGKHNSDEGEGEAEETKSVSMSGRCEWKREGNDDVHKQAVCM